MCGLPDICTQSMSVRTYISGEPREYVTPLHTCCMWASTKQLKCDVQWHLHNNL